MGRAKVRLDLGLGIVSLGLTPSWGWARRAWAWLLPPEERPVAPGLTHQQGHPAGTSPGSGMGGRWLSEPGEGPPPDQWGSGLAGPTRPPSHCHLLCPVGCGGLEWLVPRPGPSAPRGPRWPRSRRLRLLLCPRGESVTRTVLAPPTCFHHLCPSLDGRGGLRPGLALKGLPGWRGDSPGGGRFDGAAQGLWGSCGAWACAQGWREARRALKDPSGPH